MQVGLHIRKGIGGTCPARAAARSPALQPLLAALAVNAPVLASSTAPASFYSSPSTAGSHSRSGLSMEERQAQPPSQQPPLLARQRPRQELWPVQLQQQHQQQAHSEHMAGTSLQISAQVPAPATGAPSIIHPPIGTLGSQPSTHHEAAPSHIGRALPVSAENCAGVSAGSGGACGSGDGSGGIGGGGSSSGHDIGKTEGEGEAATQPTSMTAGMSATPDSSHEAAALVVNSIAAAVATAATADIAATETDDPACGKLMAASKRHGDGAAHLPADPDSSPALASHVQPDVPPAAIDQSIRQNVHDEEMNDVEPASR